MSAVKQLPGLPLAGTPSHHRPSLPLQHTPPPPHLRSPPTPPPPPSLPCVVCLGLYLNSVLLNPPPPVTRAVTVAVVQVQCWSFFFCACHSVMDVESLSPSRTTSDSHAPLLLHTAPPFLSPLASICPPFSQTSHIGLVPSPIPPSVPFQLISFVLINISDAMTEL